MRKLQQNLIYRLTSVLDEYKEELVNERRKRDLLEKENKKYKKLRETEPSAF